MSYRNNEHNEYDEYNECKEYSEYNDHKDICKNKNNLDVVKDIRKGLREIHEALGDIEKNQICEGICDIREGIKDIEEGVNDIVKTLNVIFK